MSLTDRMRERHAEIVANPGPSWHEYRQTPEGRKIVERMNAFYARAKRECETSRPKASTSKPKQRRRGAGSPKARSTRSSARSGDSPDDDPDPAVTPPAAVEAVAYAWTATLRRRHPAMSWEVVR
jgi:hypothetical protein